MTAMPMPASTKRHTASKLLTDTMGAKCFYSASARSCSARSSAPP
jgi:hypothetical protein